MARLTFCVAALVLSSCRPPSDPVASLIFEIHAPPGLAVLSEGELGTLLAGKHPDLGDRIAIAAAERQGHFHLSAADKKADPASARSLANEAAKALGEIVTEHYRARLEESIRDLDSDIREQAEKVEAARQRMQRIMEEEDLPDGTIP